MLPPAPIYQTATYSIFETYTHHRSRSSFSKIHFVDDDGQITPDERGNGGFMSTLIPKL